MVTTSTAPQVSAVYADPPRVVGWQCPVCRSVYAPHVEACGLCAPRAFVTVEKFGSAK